MNILDMITSITPNNTLIHWTPLNLQDVYLLWTSDKPTRHQFRWFCVTQPAALFNHTRSPKLIPHPSALATPHTMATKIKDCEILKTHHHYSSSPISLDFAERYLADVAVIDQLINVKEISTLEPIMTLWSDLRLYTVGLASPGHWKIVEKHFPSRTEQPTFGCKTLNFKVMLYHTDALISGPTANALMHPYRSVPDSSIIDFYVSSHTLFGMLGYFKVATEYMPSATMRHLHHMISKTIVKHKNSVKYPAEIQIHVSSRENPRASVIRQQLTGLFAYVCAQGFRIHYPDLTLNVPFYELLWVRDEQSRAEKYVVTWCLGPMGCKESTCAVDFIHVAPIEPRDIQQVSRRPMLGFPNKFNHCKFMNINQHMLIGNKSSATMAQRLAWYRLMPSYRTTGMEVPNFDDPHTKSSLFILFAFPYAIIESPTNRAIMNLLEVQWYGNVVVVKKSGDHLEDCTPEDIMSAIECVGK
ncbi:hypothetical protein FB451DRAFT_1177057 [Mycena latifolia]|nr:hypothetical protein FB451DRAFT_1177057 [Mycena latifolia]